MRADAAIYRIGITKIVGTGDAAAGERSVYQGREFRLQSRDHLRGRLRVEVLIVMALEIAAPKALPVRLQHLGYRLARGGEQGEPAQHGPQAVLLPQVVGASAKAFLAAQCTQSRVQ